MVISSRKFFKEARYRYVVPIFFIQVVYFVKGLQLYGYVNRVPLHLVVTAWVLLDHLKYSIRMYRITRSKVLLFAF